MQQPPVFAQRVARSWPRRRMRRASRMSPLCLIKPLKRTISNLSPITSAIISRHRLSKQRPRSLKICGARMPWEASWSAAKPFADFCPAKEERSSSPARPPRCAPARPFLHSPPPRQRYVPWRRGWRGNLDRSASMSHISSSTASSRANTRQPDSPTMCGRKGKTAC